MRRLRPLLPGALRRLDSGEVTPTRVACRLFDAELCRCTDYEQPPQRVPDCIKLTPHNIEALPWMPPSCAYRRLHEGKSLPRWHPLITGDPESVHEAGVSVVGQTISEECLADPEQAADFLAPELMRDRGDDDFETSPARRLGAQTTILRRRSVGLA